MYKIIGGDKKEYGPVSVEELRRWISEGRVNAQTQIQAEGSTEWKPASAFPEFADALARPAVPAPPPTPIPISAEAFAAEILARPAQVQVGRCLAQSWDLLTANVGLLFGATLLIWIIKVGANFIPMGGLAWAVLRGVFNGGLYLVFLRRIRGQPASVGDVFAGFSLALVQLLLAGLVSGVLTTIGFACCLLLPGLYLLVAWMFSVPLVADKGLEFWSAMELSRKVVTRVWFQVFGLLLLAFLPFLLTSIIVSTKIGLAAIPVMQDLMASSQPDPNQIKQAIMQIAKSSIWLGLVINFVLLLNLPFATGALMYAYENLFGPRPAPGA